jgi:hypothetical protein
MWWPSTGSTSASGTSVPSSSSSSACQVGQRAISGRSAAPQSGDEALFGDEMFGLPAAFFSAGAREVLGGLWPVNDQAALAIMPGLHEHLADGLPCAGEMTALSSLPPRGSRRFTHSNSAGEPLQALISAR